MSVATIMTIFKKYYRASPRGKVRRDYLSAFEEKMIYRTTKTENSNTTRKMVRNVLERIR